MKKIEKVIHWKILEISIMISVIILSYPLWQQLDINDYMATAAFYNEAKFTYVKVENYPQGPMFPINNQEAIKNLKRTTLKVINDTKTKEDYTLLLRIEKTSTLDFHCLNVIINDQVNSLEQLLLMDDLENYYFVLASDSLIGNQKDYAFAMWMDENTGNEMQGKMLNYSFEIQKNIAI